MIDWSGLVLGSVMDRIGQPVEYTTGGTTTTISAVFRDSGVVVELPGAPGVISRRPRLGVQLSQMPAGWDAMNAEGDTFKVVATGKSYRVTIGLPDGVAGAHLEATAL